MPHHDVRRAKFSAIRAGAGRKEHILGGKDNAYFYNIQLTRAHKTDIAKFSSIISAECLIWCKNYSICHNLFPFAIILLF